MYKLAILDIETLGHLMVRCPHCNSWDRAIQDDGDYQCEECSEWFTKKASAITDKDLKDYNIRDLLLDDDGGCGDPECCGETYYYINTEALLKLMNDIMEKKCIS